MLKKPALLAALLGTVLVGVFYWRSDAPADIQDVVENADHATIDGLVLPETPEITGRISEENEAFGVVQDAGGTLEDEDRLQSALAGDATAAKALAKSIWKCRNVPKSEHQLEQQIQSFWADVAENDPSLKFVAEALSTTARKNFEECQGIDFNPQEALRAAELGAIQGDPEASIMFYSMGVNTFVDEDGIFTHEAEGADEFATKALSYLEQARRDGSPRAFYTLAKGYKNGIFGEVDVLEAFAHLYAREMIDGQLLMVSQLGVLREEDDELARELAEIYFRECCDSN